MVDIDATDRRIDPSTGQRSAARSRNKTRSAGERGRRQVLNERASEGENTAAIGLYYLRAKSGCMHGGVHVLWAVENIMVLKS